MSRTRQHTILLTAAGGNIGKRLIPLLLKDASQPKLVLPTSNSSRLTQTLSSAASSPQVAIEEGNIQDPKWLSSILTKHSVDSVFLCLTGENELMVTLNFLDCLKRAGTVRHLVYLSACGDFSFEELSSTKIMQQVSAGHVMVKFILEAKLRYGLLKPEETGGFTYMVIGPTLFFDNDLRSKKSLLEKGFFDEPLGQKGVSRVSPSDIALAVYTSLIKDRGEKYHGQKIMVGSRKAYTGDEITALWSRHLGREITLAPGDADSLSDFEEHFKKIRSPAWARDMRLMYETFAERKFGMTEAQYKQQVEFLGKEPEQYERFVESIAKEWLATQ